MPKKGFSNEGFDITRIKPNRYRKPIKENLIMKLKKKLKQLPHLTFKYKESDEKFKWRNNKSNLSSINIDLPIIYDTEEYEDIDYSCIVIQKKTNHLTTKHLQTNKSIPWKEGDRYINRLSELLYFEQHEKIKEEERREYVDRIKNAKK